MTLNRRRTTARHLSCWLCLLALALWVALPRGVMLARDAGGALVFALCTGAGPVLVAAGADAPQHHGHGHDPGNDPGQAGDGHPCPFATSFAGAAMAHAEMAALPMALVRAESLPFPPARAAAVSVRYLRPESRGPPRLS